MLSQKVDKLPPGISRVKNNLTSVHLCQLYNFNPSRSEEDPSASSLQLQSMQDLQYFSFQESFKILFEEDHVRSKEGHARF